MTYDRPNNKWYYIFNATTSSIDIRISGDAKQYDVTTACDDDAAKDNTVGFSGTSDNLIFGSASQSVSVTIPQMCEATLVIEMSDPTQIKCYVESGSAVPDEISQYIWVSGIDDLYLNGAWTFDNTLNLYDEDGLKYNGIMNVYSEWGYLLYTESRDL